MILHITKLMWKKNIFYLSEHILCELSNWLVFSYRIKSWLSSSFSSAIVMSCPISTMRQLISAFCDWYATLVCVRIVWPLYFIWYFWFKLKLIILKYLCSEYNIPHVFYHHVFRNVYQFIFTNSYFLYVVSPDYLELHI